MDPARTKTFSHLGTDHHLSSPKISHGSLLTTKLKFLQWHSRLSIKSIKLPLLPDFSLHISMLKAKLSHNSHGCPSTLFISIHQVLSQTIPLPGLSIPALLVSCFLLLEYYQTIKANISRKPPSRTNFSPPLWFFYNSEIVMCITLCLLFTFVQALTSKRYREDI